MMQWQQELVSIAAPPFGERRRAEWLAERFRELKLQQLVARLRQKRRRGEAAGDQVEVSAAAVQTRE